MGRPPIEIDAKLVAQFARLGCTNSEIADEFNCSADTIERRFAGDLEKGRSQLKRRLRRWQLTAARKGNVVMMIWLGKQLLGQVDRSQIDIKKIDDKTFIEEVKRRLLNDETGKQNDIGEIPQQVFISKT